MVTLEKAVEKHCPEIMPGDVPAAYFNPALMTVVLSTLLVNNWEITMSGPQVTCVKPGYRRRTPTTAIRLQYPF